MIRYFIPSDGDDPDHPNIFRIKKSSSSSPVRLSHIKESFPIPGEYHFRFKKKFGNTHVWVDVTAGADPVPMYDGQVVAKVERLESQPPPQQLQQKFNRLLSLGDEKEPGENSKKQPAHTTADLLGSAYHGSPGALRRRTSSSHGALLDLSESTPAPSSQASDTGADLFGSDPFAASPAPSLQQPMQPLPIRGQMSPNPHIQVAGNQQQSHPSPTLNASHHSHSHSQPMLGRPQMMQPGMQNQQMQQQQFLQQQNLLYNNVSPDKNNMYRR